VSYDILREPEEKKLLLLISEFSNMTQKALQNYNTSAITRYCFDVAQAFNDFYA